MNLKIKNEFSLKTHYFLRPLFVNKTLDGKEVTFKSLSYLSATRLRRISYAVYRLVNHFID